MFFFKHCSVKQLFPSISDWERKALAENRFFGRFFWIESNFFYHSYRLILSTTLIEFFIGYFNWNIESMCLSRGFGICKNEWNLLWKNTLMLIIRINFYYLVHWSVREHSWRWRQVAFIANSKCAYSGKPQRWK